MLEIDNIILGLIKPGDVIRFKYQPRWGPFDDERREVFVLMPDFEGKLHCITFHELQDQEKDFLIQYRDSDAINKPSTFYLDVVKPFMDGRDIYRTYSLNRMREVEIVHDLT